MKRNIIKML